MDGVFLFGYNGPSLINRVSNDVHNSAESFGSDGDTNGSSSIYDILTSDKPFSGVHSDGSDSRVSKMLSDLEH